MTNKFESILEKVGKEFWKGLKFLVPIAETAGKLAIQDFAPELGPVFNTTVAAVALAEQKAAALGQQSGTGPQKLADVVQIVGPVIAQGLADAGKPNDEAAVEKFISEVVGVLNVVPADTATAAPTPIAVVPAPEATAAPAPNRGLVVAGQPTS